MMLLLALLPCLQEKAPDFPAELKSLLEEYRKAESEFYRPLREAKTEEERRGVKLDYSKHPAGPYVSKFADLARRAKGTETAAKALLEVIRLAIRSNKKDEAGKALDSLVTDHIDSPILESLAGELGFASRAIGRERCADALRKIAEKSPHKKVRAAAIFSLATGMMNDPKKAGEARELLVALQKDYADTPYAKKAEGYLFEMDHLQVGKTAPDFEATDQDGKTFKLSDYRGKVVIVDFWGFW